MKTKGQSSVQNTTRREATAKGALKSPGGDVEMPVLLGKVGVGRGSRAGPPGPDYTLGSHQLFKAQDGGGSWSIAQSFRVAEPRPMTAMSCGDRHSGPSIQPRAVSGSPD